MVIEARVAKVLEKFDLRPDDLRLPEGQLEARLVRDGMPPEAREALEALGRLLPGHYDALRDAAARVDPTLRKPIENARNAAETGLRDIEKRIVSHLKQQNDILVQQVAKARANLFPLGRPQERVFTIAPYLVRYGTGFLDAAFDAVARWTDALEPVRGGT
jgi:uncharacterized protein YllA (UPF0747 family)